MRISLELCARLLLVFSLLFSVVGITGAGFTAGSADQGTAGAEAEQPEESFDAAIQAEAFEEANQTDELSLVEWAMADSDPRQKAAVELEYDGPARTWLVAASSRSNARKLRTPTPKPSATVIAPAPTATATASPPPPLPTATATTTPQPTATATTTPSPTPTPPPSSSGRQIYWGAWVQGPPWDMTKQTAFESMAGKGASIMHWGQGWKSGGVYQPFYSGDFEKVRAHGSIPMLDWGSWNLGSGISQADFQLADIYNGAHDAHIRNWATGAKNWGKPLFLRFNWEMNGNWFPWGEKANGNQPGDYAKAWRHVVDIFRSVGATNVKWVWCPNTDYSGATPLASLYPGDAYVDWVGIDGYNWAATRGSPWMTFTQVMKPTYDQLRAIAPTKPIMIGETATDEDGGPLGRPASKAAWIQNLLTTELPVNFPAIKALVWFNWDAGGENPDWPIQTSQQAIDAFKAGIRLSNYSSNTFGSITSIAVPQ